MLPNNKKIFIFLVIFLILFVSITTAIFLTIYTYDNKPDCFIHINKDTTQRHPLILNTNSIQFYQPNHVNGLTIKHGEKLLLSCPGETNHLKLNKTNISEITATCIKSSFQVNNTNYQFKELQCINYPEVTAKYSGDNCSNLYRQINVGFATKRGFLIIYSTCFNPANLDALYSKFNLTRKIKTYQHSKRPRFKSLDFYKKLTIDPSIIYTRKYQQHRFEELLNTTKYISLKSDYFLARGHLTAKADFIYASQQRATFLYVNVAPQWQTFNGKNWMELEKSLRDFVSINPNDFVVYTGVYGSAKLLNINGTLMKLTLYNNKTVALSIPDIFWKIIYDPVTNKGVVFVGHNNPYETKINRYCTDICDKINWVITWNRYNLTNGFSYCCDYLEFKTIVDYVPELPINGILI